jgi:predicted MFS family arabinose efflux permease
LLSRRTAWTVAMVATLTMTVSYIDRSSLAVLGHSVSKALDINETQFGWLASAFSIAYLFATPLAGWWIDRIGARRGLVISVLLWTTVAALHAIVPGFGILFAMRIALGITEGPSFPGASQTIQRVLPPEERPRGFGVLFTGSSIGGMIVPPLAGALFNIGGWRFAFLGTALAGLLWIPAWILVTRHPDVRARLDAHTVKTDAPRPKLVDLARDRNVLRAWAAILAVAPVTGFGVTWGAKYLIAEQGLTQGQVGHYLWLPPLLFDLGAVVFGDLASRRPSRRRALFVVGMLLATGIGFVHYADGPWPAVVVLGVAMAGGGVVYTLATADVLGCMPPNAISFAAGTIAAAQSMIHIIGNPLVGASIDHTGSYTAALVTTAAWVIPGCIAWLAIRPRDPA